MSEYNPEDHPELRRAVHQWVEEHAFRFVRPSRECWPEGVESREDATEHYGDAATSEILEYMDESEPENDECPDCGGVGEFVGEEPIGRAGPPYQEVYRCITKNCDRDRFTGN